MNTAKEHLIEHKPELLKKLRANRLAIETTEAMEDYAIEFAASLLPDDDFPELVRRMRTEQKKYFKTRTKGALIAAKELEKKVDIYLKTKNT